MSTGDDTPSPNHPGSPVSQDESKEPQQQIQENGELQTEEFERTVELGESTQLWSPEETEVVKTTNIGVEVAPESHSPEEKEDLSAPDPASYAPAFKEEDVMQPSCGTQANLEVDHSQPNPSSPMETATKMEAGKNDGHSPELDTDVYMKFSEIDVLVDATVYPMGFRVVVRAPGSPGGKIATRFVFESIASRLGIHPEVIKLSCRGKRIRFGETIDCERVSPLDKCRLWIDVHFSEDNIPVHLQNIKKDDHFARCVQAHARLEPICPADLVAARRCGLNFDEAIRDAWRNTKRENILTVAILHDPRGIRMPFLGGYRMKTDHSRVFLHAATQLTSPGDKSLAELQHGPVPREGISRKTQTYGLSRSSQTLREGRTQTSRPDYEVDTTFDEVVVAKPYFTSLQLFELQSAMAVVMQKMYRVWKARKVHQELAAARKAFFDNVASKAAAEEAEKRCREEFERRRRAIPRTADDFATLRRELEAWRAAASMQILSDATLSEVEKRAALTDLTKKEVQLLHEYENLRTGVLKDRRARRFENILALMTNAKECGTVSVTTQAAERARELRQLYLALAEKPISTEARLDVLLHVKWTVKEFDVPLTRQMVELIDRESDLLHRGRTANSLAGLRTRLESLFKRFIATPEYNHAVDELVRGPVFGAVLDEAASTAAASRRLKPSNVV